MLPYILSLSKPVLRRLLSLSKGLSKGAGYDGKVIIA
jgi:hypothetical protein